MAISMESVEAGMLTSKEINEGMEQIKELIGNSVGAYTKTMDSLDMKDPEELKLMVQSIQVAYKVLEILQHSLNTLNEVSIRCNKIDEKVDTIDRDLRNTNNDIVDLKFQIKLKKEES